MAKPRANKSEPATSRAPAAPRKRTTRKPTTTDATGTGVGTVEIVVTQEQIAQRAHELSAAAGHPAGRDVEFWLEAERQLHAELGR